MEITNKLSFWSKSEFDFRALGPYVQNRGTLTDCAKIREPVLVFFSVPKFGLDFEGEGVEIRNTENLSATSSEEKGPRIP